MGSCRRDSGVIAEDTITAHMWVAIMFRVSDKASVAISLHQKKKKSVFLLLLDSTKVGERKGGGGGGGCYWQALNATPRHTGLKFLNVATSPNEHWLPI